MTDGALQVFGRRGDPEGIALVVARELRGGQVKRRGAAYRVTATAKQHLLRQGKPDMTVDVDSKCFEGRSGERERTRVGNDVVRTMRGPGLDTVLGMIPELRIAVSFLPADTGRPLPPTDPLYSVALDVATRTDGFVLDQYNGRILSATGEVWGSTELFVADGAAPVDPSPARIGARLVALVAVAARALTEYDGRDVEEARDGILEWVRAVGTTAELEDFESVILLRAPGEMEEAETAHGSWQIEGAVVLAWALDLLDNLPAHDEAVDPAVVSGLLRFPDADATRKLLSSGARRHHAIVDDEAERHYAIYWRLCEFTSNPRELDLEAFVHAGSSGSLRFERVPLFGGDRAVGGVPIADADADSVEVALSIAAERLRALNWLRRGGLYSATQLQP
jgi:hypothetical protein